ncbi:cobalt ECF transporter T component CbiQ [Rhizobium sp. RU36D]|uniref:cobalt ECF transporter T component CbiQ n=1 Tax=Rhizobium sp. RU36D TaxID=1907415 RepID=UPI0009D853CA|nr:cobalt ECF transporter T component CbiQ [Rhizobium sp. RU36D]SMD19294.1 cobalt/nickel transport system permease protein [Rhizobium sp. RU36D]
MRAIDRSAQTNRWRHHAAGEKVMLSLGIMIISLSSTNWGLQLATLVSMVVLMVVGAGISCRDVGRAARVPVLFIATGTFAQLFSVSLEGYVPSFALSPEAAVHQALFVALRSAACISALLFLALTTPLSSILQLMQRMGLNAEISDIAMVMFRIIWVLLDCLDAGRQSLEARLGYSGNRRLLKSNGLLLASLLPRVFARARRMETGLAARGYTGRLDFISIERPASHARLLLIGTLLALLFALTWWLG